MDNIVVLPMTMIIFCSRNRNKMNSMKVLLLLGALVGVSVAIKCKVGIDSAAVDLDCTSGLGKCLT